MMACAEPQTAGQDVHQPPAEARSRRASDVAVGRFFTVIREDAKAAKSRKQVTVWYWLN
jgi:hypothetical protein